MKQANAAINTTLHPDGAVSHKVTYADGSSDLVLIKADHALAQRFLAHGSRVKLQAAINSAKSREEIPGKVSELDKAFGEGRWTMQEGSSKPKGTATARALAAIKGCDLSEAEAFLKGLSKAEQAKLRAVPAVAAKIIELEAEDRNAGGGDLLGGFLGEGVSASAPAEENA